MIVHPWTVVESIHGRFIVNRHCAFQIDHLAKTGVPHIQHEIETILTIVATLPDRCVVVDAGANIGLIAVPVAAAIKDRGGQVAAFEVQLPVFQALCGTSVLNDLPNLGVFNMGLGAERTTMWVPNIDYSAPQDFGTVSLINQTNEGRPVVIVPLDELDLPRLDFLKIDVEGMEAAVLTGARRSLAEFRPWVWVEYFLSDVAALKAVFDGLDYRFFRMDAQNMLAVPASRLAESGIRIDAAEM